MAEKILTHQTLLTLSSAVSSSVWKLDGTQSSPWLSWKLTTSSASLVWNSSRTSSLTSNMFSSNSTHTTPS